MTRKLSAYTASFLAVVCFLFPFTAWKALSAASKPSDAIQAVLDAQVVAWNHGDINGFMEGYQRSPELIYIGNETVVRGWQELLDFYHSSLKRPGGAEMGVLQLSEEHLIMLNNKAAIVWGKYTVDTPDGKHRGGLYTLAMRELPEGWRTVYDRTSSLKQ